MENFPGSKIIDPITWEPLDHPLNKEAPPPPKKRRRKKGYVDPNQGGLF